MKVQNLQSQNLNDGYLGVYENKHGKSDFNAPKNPKGIEDLNYIVDLAYAQMSKRDQDFEFAHSIDRNLSLKVKTRLYQKVTKANKVILDDMLYDIINIDYSKETDLMYLYMEEVRSIVK